MINYGRLAYGRGQAATASLAAVLSLSRKAGRQRPRTPTAESPRETKGVRPRMLSAPRAAPSVMLEPRRKGSVRSPILCARGIKSSISGQCAELGSPILGSGKLEQFALRAHVWEPSGVPRRTRVPSCATMNSACNRLSDDFSQWNLVHVTSLIVGQGDMQ